MSKKIIFGIIFSFILIFIIFSSKSNATLISQDEYEMGVKIRWVDYGDSLKYRPNEVVLVFSVNDHQKEDKIVTIKVDECTVTKNSERDTFWELKTKIKLPKKDEDRNTTFI